MTQKAPPPIKKLKAAAALRSLMADYYQELDRAAAEGAKVAWCTSVGPVELLRALGFRVYFPENHGAMLGATRKAASLIPAAGAAGYSPDVCSYLTSDIGAHLRRETPLSQAYGIDQPPRPDVLVYNTNQCREVQDWLAFYQRAFDVPLLGVQTPRSMEQISRSHLEGVAAQHRELCAALEPIAGCRLDLERLRQVTASSFRCSTLWGQVLRLASQRPAPFSFFDGVIHMGPAVVLRGDPRAEAYYQTLLGEVQARVAAGQGAVDDERWRLYWEGMPIWGLLRAHFEQLASLGACVVGSTYCSSWVFEALGEDDPFWGMARAYSELFIVRGETHKEAVLRQELAALGVDGVIFHDAKTCPHNTNSRYGLPARLQQALGLPTVVVSGDLNDLRLVSSEQTRTLLEALVEQLAELAERRS